MAEDDQILQRFGREMPRGAVVFREGEVGREMYVLQRGRVVITRRAGALETVLGSLGPGEMFGEMAILGGQSRSATATVTEDALVIVLDGGTLEVMVRSRPEIAVRMLRTLASRLQAADERIASLLSRGAPGPATRADQDRG